MPSDLTPRNRLLAALAPDDLGRFAPHLDLVELAHGAVLHEPPGEVAHVWFPEGGAVSIAVALRRGGAEGAVVGLEGAVGLVDALGDGRASARAIVQVPGPALRLPVDPLLAALEASAALRRLCAGYVQAFVAEALHSAACHAAHKAEARLARWLLLVQDRVADGAALPLGQAFLALMLGVRRTTVTEVAGRLQVAGLIAYRQGRIHVLDRVGLEAAACECYGAIRRCYGRLAADGGTGSGSGGDTP